MNILGLIFFSFGILLVIFGISIFTPFLSWVGKRFNSSSSINYNQPKSIRVTNLLIGIFFFSFGLFITIVSAAYLGVTNSSNNQYLPKSQSFPSPMIPEQKLYNPLNKKYKLNCPPNADGLNMRKQPGLNTQIITLIPCNATEIQDKTKRRYKDGIQWYLVEYQQQIGWVAGKYLQQQVRQQDKNIFVSKLIAKKRP